MNIKFPPNFTESQKATFMRWLSLRPDKIREMIKNTPPFAAYRLLGGNQDFYTPVSYAENGTVRMKRWANDSFQPMWEVFGMDPKTLEPHPDGESFLSHILLT